MNDKSDAGSNYYILNSAYILLLINKQAVRTD